MGDSAGDQETRSPATACHDPYRPHDGIFRPPTPIEHREEEYPTGHFEIVRHMQARHFWYRGRHRLLRYALRRYLRERKGSLLPRLIDVGGGCGGWIAELAADDELAGVELALADSSLTALQHAAEFIPASIARYQVDLLALGWRNRWDVIFLLDVLEHVADDSSAMRQLAAALAPGGVLIVTSPALQRFWTWNDELAGHQRRYARADFARLAGQCGLRLRDSRYFMFTLSPLLLLSRWCTQRRVRAGSPQQAQRIMESMHRVPHPVLNTLLRATLAAETPLGHYIRFPWGTSILGVFGKSQTP